VRLVEQWTTIENGLDPSWADARLLLTVSDESRSDRAAALLAPCAPGRADRALRLVVVRRGGGVGPEGIRRLLRRLDAEGIDGRLELVASTSSPAEPAVGRRSVEDSWDAALALLPSDWSDLYCELELASTDDLEQAALLLAPLNPARYGEETGFRFRCAATLGYGASPGMVRRCFSRLDAQGIQGEARILHALSDTHPVGTQGPVWHIRGRTV
jgi:hypothetical protein